MCVFWGNSLGIGHGGVLSEGEVVGDVFVIWQPAVCPYQPVWTHSHLDRKSAIIQKCLKKINLLLLFGPRESVQLNHTSISEPWMMKERVWFFGTTAWTRGRPSLTTWTQTHVNAHTPTQYELVIKWNDEITTGLFKTHLYKGPELWELLKDIQGHSVQAGLPPHCIFSWHTRRMRFLVGDRNMIYGTSQHFVDNQGFKSSCELVWEMYLKELAGSLSKVADDAFQGLALRLVGNCIQIYCTCRITRSKGESRTRTQKSTVRA